MRKLFFTFSLIIFALSFSVFVHADTIGESVSFNIQSDYDLNQRSEISAIYIEGNSILKFYVDSDFWSSLRYHEQRNIESSLTDLANEFKNNIYPTLTETFGFEWKPGVDDDEKITVLFHEMKGGASGYFNSGDEYKVIQIFDSNEREMVYLSPEYIGEEQIKSFLAHEFMHLITFNRKEKEHNITEEIWLNESRSEYVPKLLGYEGLSIDNVFRKRIETFVGNPNDSLCEWGEKEEDYGIINIFIHYLAEHYGINILVDSLNSNKTGIESINYALEKNGFEKRFSEIFTDWAIAILINDCGISPDYCYEDENLKNFKVVPSLNLMPLNGKSSLIVSDSTKNWSGKWYKFAGGRGDLEIMFAGSSNNIYKVPYVVKDFSGNIEDNFFELDSNQRGKISVSDFGEEILAVTVIPLLQTKTSDFLEKESSLPFIIEASTIAEPSISINFEKPISDMSEEEILEKISQLEGITSQLRERIQELSPESKYSKFESNLYFGMRGNEVKKLQQFLSEQGEEIYPEKLVTGNFLSLTRQAVIRFQEKYADEILTPLGLTEGTGYFGPSTRKKINKLLGY